MLSWYICVLVYVNRWFCSIWFLDGLIFGMSCDGVNVDFLVDWK